MLPWSGSPTKGTPSNHAGTASDDGFGLTVMKVRLEKVLFVHHGPSQGSDSLGPTLSTSIKPK